MPKQIIGRVQPAYPVDYDSEASYGLLCRVSYNGSVYECIKAAAAGESPEARPECWLCVSAGIDAADVAAIQASLNTAVATADAAKIQADKALGNAATAQTAADDARLKSLAAEGLAQAALPKSGGELSGGISLPSPEADVCGQEAVTAAWIRRYAYERAAGNLRVFVGGAGASDEGDIRAGWGLAVGRPFASLAKAVSAIAQNYAGLASYICIELQEDTNISDTLAIAMPHVPQLLITGSDPAIKLNVGASLQVTCGHTRMSNLDVRFSGGGHMRAVGYYNLSALSFGDISFSGESWYLYAMGVSASITFALGNITFGGTASGAFVQASNGGVIQIVSTGGSLTGANASGSRYRARNGGRILTGGAGPDFFPGSEDGTLDASSIYA